MDSICHWCGVCGVKAPVWRARGFATVMQRGFTLIEMLVVLLVMGLLVGLVAASAAPDERALLRVEVERLAQVLDLAATESRLTGQAIAWTADGPGYRFWRFSDVAGWFPIVDDALRARTLPQGMTISNLNVETTRSPEHMRLQFSPYGGAPSFSVIMSFGEARYTVENSPVGEVRVLPDAGTGIDSSVRHKLP